MTTNQGSGTGDPTPPVGSSGPGSRYVPALGFRFLTRFYDSVLEATLPEKRFKERLVAEARLAPSHRVLDLGCGTGTLTLMLAEACPDASVVGMDGDPDVLAIARQKARDAGVALAFHHGMADAPPFEAGSFDRVVSSLVFHHLGTTEKLAALRAVRSLLRPGGELHVADWGQAQNLLMRLAFLPVQLLDGFACTADNVAGRLPDLMIEAGFPSADEVHRQATLLGTLSLYRARVP